MNAIEKEVDNLGRMVIPSEFRKKLNIESNSKILVSLEDGILLVSPVTKHCALCGAKIESEQRFRLCEPCVSKIKSEK